MRYILIILITLLTSSQVTGKDLFDELLIKSIKTQPEIIISTCKNNKEWCNGYFVATIHSLNEVDNKVCFDHAKNMNGIENSLWSIVNSWLYRQPQDIEITIHHAVVTAFTEFSSCDKVSN